MHVPLCRCVQVRRRATLGRYHAPVCSLPVPLSRLVLSWCKLPVGDCGACLCFPPLLLAHSSHVCTLYIQNSHAAALIKSIALPYFSLPLKLPDYPPKSQVHSLHSRRFIQLSTPTEGHRLCLHSPSQVASSTCFYV